MADGSQTAAQQAAAQNLPNRAALIGTGLYMTRMLQPVSAALGQQLRVPLDRVGIVTGVTLQFTLPVNVTAAATASPFGPYSLASLLTYTDFAGLQRVITNGAQLHMLNCFKGHKIAGNAVNYDYLPTSEIGINTNITHVPTAVAADTISFFLYVPLAYDPTSDLRGAVLAQSIYGEHYITINTASALVGTDPLAFPYTAGTIATTGQVTVQAFMHYIMPQQGVNNLPMVDLSTIYAIEGNYNDSANFNAGQPKYINWPNNRAILSAMHIINNGATGGVLNETNITKITLLGNSNTNIKELSPALLRYQMRYQLQTDMPSGVLYLPSRSQPITTQLYGNVQTKLDMNTVSAGTYALSQYESTYLSGTPLPGVIQ